MPYLSASAVVIHYAEALYQVYAPLPLPFTFTCFICGTVAAVVHKITVANMTVHGFNENKW